VKLTVIGIAFLALALGLGGPLAVAASAAPAAEPVRISIYFQRGEATLTSEADAVLDEVVKTIRQGRTARIIIIGYTDQSGSPDANRRLAAKRADAVRQGLIDRGLDADSIAVHSASVQPSSTPSDGGAIAERRADVIIVPEGAVGE